MDDHLLSRFHRVFTILSLIQSGQRLTAGQLATDLGVSRRTVFRDVNLLRDSGIPVYFDEDADTYRISHTHQLPPLDRFSEREISLLLLATATSVLHFQPEISQLLRHSIGKLTSVLPKELRMWTDNVLENCNFTHPSDSPVSTGVLWTIINAMHVKRQVHVDLHAVESKTRSRQLLVSPYYLDLSVQRWALIGRAKQHSSLCRLDLKKVSAASLTDQTFTRPRNLASRIPHLTVIEI
jgi:predicted DNA-binding transcriptional regulator YafY